MVRSAALWGLLLLCAHLLVVRVDASTRAVLQRVTERGSQVANSSSESCIVCPAVVPKCDCNVNQRCIIVKQNCTACSTAVCLEAIAGSSSNTLQPVIESQSSGGRHFLFGYGSLINKRSRQLTGDTGDAVPARVRGLKRSWSYAQKARSMTAVGAQFEEGSSTNGLLVIIPESSLPAFDAREKFYTRKQLSHSQVHILQQPVHNHRLRRGDKVWVYIADTPSEPTSTLPITQSYVDVVLDGALEQGRKFAEEVVRTTGNWRSADGSVRWENDRDSPRIYDRNFVSPQRKAEIDDILKSVIPKEFALRKTGSGSSTSTSTSTSSSSSSGSSSSSSSSSDSQSSRSSSSSSDGASSSTKNGIVTFTSAPSTNDPAIVQTNVVNSIYTLGGNVPTSGCQTAAPCA